MAFYKRGFGAPAFDQNKFSEFCNTAPQDVLQSNESGFVEPRIGVPFELLHNAAKVGESPVWGTARHYDP